ncbi:hypothetical protein LTR53_006183 [Teratosphaeriaceae sp. CCFEE 6253]|nr:hypothetical protein LTR53_006183 [Teratosphaeriaceae sp. CCFEE 6253]
MFSMYSVFGANFINNRQEQGPPPAPTPLCFPTYETDGYSIDGPVRFSELQSLYAKVRRSTDVAPHHLEALGIEVRKPCTLSDLIPDAIDGSSYLPPRRPDEATTAAWNAADPAADDAASKKRKAAFDESLAELQLDNETAFSTLSRRNLRDGSKPPRLTHSRQFWQGLSNMSRYWDDTSDVEPASPVPEWGGERDAKRMRLDVAADEASADAAPTPRAMVSAARDKATVLPTPTPSPERLSPPPSTLHEGGPQSAPHPAAADHESRPLPAAPSPLPPPRHHHHFRRTETGRDMPASFREETLLGFVESALTASGLHITSPRHLPIVQFGTLRIPTRLTATAHRVPADETRARRGRREGPVLVLQARGETDFAGAGGEPREAESRLDLLRELGCLLQLAQERRREGRKEAKWWTCKPRWGAAASHETPGKAGVGEGGAAGAGLDGAPETTRAKLMRRQLAREALCKDPRPPSGTWDTMTDYVAIGKDPDSPYDEVFLLSSLNHHIAILKLTVHEAYVDALASGTEPGVPPTEADWCRPRLERSRWFDLFQPRQREEAFRGVGGVMAYLMRECGRGGAGGGRGEGDGVV